MLIYKITNIINNKIYIGKTKNEFKKRYACYKSDYKSSRHSSYLYKAFNKYGLENFKFEILIENIITLKELNYAERYFIAYYKSNNKNIGYNSTEGGDGGIRMFNKDNPMYGKKREDLIKLNKSRVGIPLSNNHKQKIGKSTKGKKHNELTIIKMKKIKRTEEQKNNISKKNKKIVYCNNIKFDSITDLANYLQVGLSTISQAIKRKNKVKGNIIHI